MIAAAILRHIHSVINTGQARDPLIATHPTQVRTAMAARALVAVAAMVIERG